MNGLAATWLGELGRADATTVSIVVLLAVLVAVVVYVLKPGGGDEDEAQGPVAEDAEAEALPSGQADGADVEVDSGEAAEDSQAPAGAAEVAPAPRALDDAETAEEPSAGEPDEAKAGEVAAVPGTLARGLDKTRSEGFVARLGGLFRGKKVDDALLDEIEEVLFTADIGVRTAERLLEAVRKELKGHELQDAEKVWAVLREQARQILAAAAANDHRGQAPDGAPFVTMVLGVNGAGKTTTIGKVAHQEVEAGKTVVLVAGDTFRAAAAEQLEIWGKKVGAVVHRGKEGADPASVVFDGVRRAVEDGVDHVLVDTAGRLHTQVNLMEELRKVRRVMGKAIEGAPHEVLMVLDATTGQNAIQQAKMFHDATDVTGIVLTKLDGTAKGGIVLGVCEELSIPIRFVGVGERVVDLRPFVAEEFIEALFG